MGLFPDPPLTPKLKKRLFGGSSPRKSVPSESGAGGGSSGASGSGGRRKNDDRRNQSDRCAASGSLSKSSTPQQLSTSWEFIRSVSADNQYEVEREGLNEIIATPRYLEFLKNYREEAAATSEALAVASPRYIEVRKGRIVLESQQQLQPQPAARCGPPTSLLDCAKTDHLHERDSVLRINRARAAGSPVGPLSDTNTLDQAATLPYPAPLPPAGIIVPQTVLLDRYPPLPRSPSSPPPPPPHQTDGGGNGDDGGTTTSTASSGSSSAASPHTSPLRECGKLVRNTSGLLDSSKSTEMLEARIAELEEALLKLQERVNQSQCSSPTLEKEIKEHLEVMSKAMKTKDRKSMQVCREHKTLQVRFQKQENSLLALQNENKSLHQRVRQYETCLDDIMRKVVDALVAEDSLRDEVAILKGRVRDLEAQNAALVTASPAKSRDEGYCTMSSGQPQPTPEGHLEELPEEPEQWLVSAEPCTADMEDWSMSQEELATALDEENHEWIWNSSFLTTAETQTEDITAALLHEQIVYSEDEEVACTNFTRDFYRLVSFTSGSTRSLHSPLGNAGVGVGPGRQEEDLRTTEESKDSSSSTVDATDGDSSDDNERLSQSPTPSEGGRAQVLSCSSSDSSDALTEKLQLPPLPQCKSECGDDIGGTADDSPTCCQSPTEPQSRSLPPTPVRRFGMKKLGSDSSGTTGGSSVTATGGGASGLSINTADLLQDVLITCHNQLNKNGVQHVSSASAGRSPNTPTPPSWRKSMGWRRVQRGSGGHETHIPVPIAAKDRLKSPPPVPIRRTSAR
ncbi:uncharacterized protein LOC128266878 [Anopheles cruzii]|uniref:uncharacterized protein LOC128266878 n=1 Tax=Anopheles cruzii TaxID=68878 RepID=UPI0022EC2C86|nr:uncharacterized protein LOC128266878 [Anopheles cruzii]